MKTFVAVTDDRWYRFLQERPSLTEANFWLPGGGPRTYGLHPGEPMLFKTHHPHDRLVGMGVLSDYRRLPLSIAWSAFGEANGCATEASLLKAISRYRGSTDADPVIGCVMLRDTVFVPPTQGLRPPRDFAKNIVTVKGYDLDGDTDPAVAVALAVFERIGDALGQVDVAWQHDGPVYGAPRPATPRLGQAAFAAVVSAAYDMRCAITGNRVRPVLQAAHIRPVAEQGQHRVDNGLLLRSDVHILFDKGYLGVHPERHELLVSPGIRERFGNGEEFYSRQGSEIAVPQRRADRPSREFLQWHLDTVFGRSGR